MGCRSPLFGGGAYLKRSYFEGKLFYFYRLRLFATAITCTNTRFVGITGLVASFYLITIAVVNLSSIAVALLILLAVTFLTILILLAITVLLLV